MKDRGREAYIRSLMDRPKRELAETIASLQEKTKWMERELEGAYLERAPDDYEQGEV